MNRAVLDTDTLSAIMRQDTAAVARAAEYLAVHARLTISIITRYEILRGLKAKHADKQIATFGEFCSTTEVLPLTDAVVVRAAGIYGDLHRTGRLIGDADVLIAATCLENGCEIVTNNTSHFSRIDGMAVQNWLT